MEWSVLRWWFGETITDLLLRKSRPLEYLRVCRSRKIRRLWSVGTNYPLDATSRATERRMTVGKAVLISINPPHTNNIFDELKGIEWRTKPMPTGKHYCYETKKCFGLGKVIGEYKVWRVKRYENTSFIPEGYIDLGCVPMEFLEAYSKGRPLYAHFIICPKRYDKPKELSEFLLANTQHYCHLQRPPQSWCYVEELR